MIGAQRQHIVLLAKHIFDKSLQGLLGPYLDKNSNAGIVKGLQPFYKLHRSSHLPGEHIDHLRLNSRPHRVGFPGHVGHDRQRRRADVHLRQYPPQRLAGRGDNLGVKGVAHRQQAGGEAGFLQRFHRLLDPVGGAADHRLAVTVDVGDHHVPLDGVDDLFDFLQWAKAGGHQAVVGHRYFRHFRSPGAHRLEGIGKRKRAGRHQGAVFAQTVPHHHVRRHAVGCQQAGQSQIDRQHCRLGNLRLAQGVIGLFQIGRVVAVNENIAAERPRNQRFHNIVGFPEGIGHQRIGRLQLF